MYCQTYSQRRGDKVYLDDESLFRRRREARKRLEEDHIALGLDRQCRCFNAAL